MTARDTDLSSPDSRQQGRVAEEHARRYLEAQGLTLEECNYRCRRGEIDLIMRDGDCLVFVEVRLRRSARYGGGAESVDRRKQQKLIHTARHYLQNRRAGNRPARFDVVALSGRGSQLEVQWIRNAFGA